jgi:hypothetical protein
MKSAFGLTLGLCAVLFAPTAWAAPAQVRAPAGTAVQVELVDPVSTKAQKAGDSFALRLAAPLIVNGKVLLAAGTPGVGVVIESSKPGMGGKAAKLVLSASSLTRGRVHVPLDGLQLSGAGRGNAGAANAIGISGIVLGPIGFVGMAVQGGHVVFPAGTRAQARLASSVMLASLGPASRSDRALALSAQPAVLAESAVRIGPPPRGQGQVIFFRPRSVLGTGQWFNVREDGKALGKLTNGAYFVQITPPGPHTYTATSEPEFKDSLKLKVDPGETYYVEGILTHGVVIGAAGLSPSNQAAFAKASHNLKAAGAEAAAEGASGVQGQATTR